MRYMRYSNEEHDAHARTSDRDGMVLLTQHFRKETLSDWRQAFDGILAHRLQENATAVHGADTHYITLPR